MYSIQDISNTIICGHALDILTQIPKESIHMCITSPPYWGKRSYKTPEIVWDGSKECEHDFSIETEGGDIHYRPGYNSQVWYCKNPEVWEGNTKGYMCLKCGAWKGELGHEPTPELYVSHLCQIFDEVKRVLKKEGTCFVNLGDTYWGSGGSGGHTLETINLGRRTFEYGAYPTASLAQKKHEYLQAKSQCCIPELFAIEMVKRGWIKRNSIIWYKPNCMPESPEDRFTVDFEYIFFFTKNNDNLYYTNEKTLKLTTRQPRTDIEGIDWIWIACPRCSIPVPGNGANTGVNNKIPYEQNNPHRMRLDILLESENKQCTLNYFSDSEEDKYVEEKERVCRKCSGTGKVKHSLWKGHDYYFEQQFEPYKFNRWGGRYKTNENVKTSPRERQCGGQGSLNRMGYDCYPNSLGRNMRCVWEITVASFKGAHFAVYPEELIITPIKAGCPEFVCKNCGSSRIKILRSTGNYIEHGGYGSKTAEHVGVSPSSSILTKQVKEKAVAGYSTCDCNAGYEPGIVLDPFMGSGTTALVALKLGRRFIGIDSNPKYVDMAYERIKPYLEQKKVVEVFT